MDTEKKRKQQEEEVRKRQQEQAEKERQQRQQTRSEARQEQPRPRTTPPDYYELLGVAQTASEVEIRRAFNLKLRDFHQDLEIGLDPEAAAQIREKREHLLQGLDILTNWRKRAEYGRQRPQRSPKTEAAGGFDAGREYQRLNNAPRPEYGQSAASAERPTSAEMFSDDYLGMALITRLQWKI